MSKTRPSAAWTRNRAWTIVNSGHIPFTPRAKKVLELSLREALQLGHNYIGTEHILLGLIREGEGVAAQVLVKLGADLNRVRQQVIQLLSGYQGKEPTETGGTRGEAGTPSTSRQSHWAAIQLGTAPGRLHRDTAQPRRFQRTLGDRHRTRYRRYCAGTDRRRWVAVAVHRRIPFRRRNFRNRRDPAS